MEANILIPLIAGLSGTLIGAFSSILVIWIQQKNQTKREKLKLACDMATEDRKHSLELAVKDGRKATLMPVVVFQHYHLQILDAMEKGKLTEKKILEIKLKNRELIEAVKSF
jgi:hypothetical protein